MSVPASRDYPYRQVAAGIAAKIQAGYLKPGEKLPSIRDLAIEYRTTTATVQKAIRQLTDDGFAETQPGIGVYVPNRIPDVSAEPVTDLREEVTELRATVTNLAERLHRLEQAAGESS
jgi:DNA-binding transcriptional regulator YhcF (GntR family)